VKVRLLAAIGQCLHPAIAHRSAYEQFIAHALLYVSWVKTIPNHTYTNRRFVFFLGRTIPASLNVWLLVEASSDSWMSEVISFDRVHAEVCHPMDDLAGNRAFLRRRDRIRARRQKYARESKACTISHIG